MDSLVRATVDAAMVRMEGEEKEQLFSCTPLLTYPGYPEVVLREREGGREREVVVVVKLGGFGVADNSPIGRKGFRPAMRSLGTGGCGGVDWDAGPREIFGEDRECSGS